MTPGPGAVGATGPRRQGPLGPQGTQGPQGKGSQGPQGTQVTGIESSQGPTGSKGSQGTIWPNSDIRLCGWCDGFDRTYGSNPGSLGPTGSRCDLTNGLNRGSKTIRYGTGATRTSAGPTGTLIYGQQCFTGIVDLQASIIGRFDLPDGSFGLASDTHKLWVYSASTATWNLYSPVPVGFYYYYDSVNQVIYYVVPNISQTLFVAGQGDFFIDGTLSIMYQYQSGHWVFFSNLKGMTGPTGVARLDRVRYRSDRPCWFDRFNWINRADWNGCG